MQKNIFFSEPVLLFFATSEFHRWLSFCKKKTGINRFLLAIREYDDRFMSNSGGCYHAYFVALIWVWFCGSKVCVAYLQARKWRHSCFIHYFWHATLAVIMPLFALLLLPRVYRPWNQKSGPCKHFGMPARWALIFYHDETKASGDFSLRWTSPHLRWDPECSEFWLMSSRKVTLPAKRAFRSREHELRWEISKSL